VVDTGIYTVGGTVQAAGGVYIPRQADRELLASCRAGTFAYILTARQMGKSSLMVETAQQLNQEGIRSVIIDLTSIGAEVTSEEWYFSILAIIKKQLRLKIALGEWWQANSALSMNQRLIYFFLEVLLKEIRERIVIFVDEIDTTLKLSFTDDFFAAIRYLYNARSNVPEFQRISFVLIGVATPGDLIRDPQRTPFNIGQRVDLSDWTQEEALPLAAGFGLPSKDNQRLLYQVLQWTGGHPYLTQRLCQAIGREIRGMSRTGLSDTDLLQQLLTQSNRSALGLRSTLSPEQLLRKLLLEEPVNPVHSNKHHNNGESYHWSREDVADIVRSTFFDDKSEQDHNLLFVRDMLTKRAPDIDAVLMTYRQIRHGRRIRDEEQLLIKSHLKLSGVVRRDDKAFLHIRNPIYATVFDDRWIKKHFPPTSARRIWTKRLQRAALILTALLLIASIVLPVYLLIVQRAETARAVAVAGQATAKAGQVTAEAEQSIAKTAQQKAEIRQAAAELAVASAEAQRSMAIQVQNTAHKAQQQAQAGQLTAVAQQQMANLAQQTAEAGQALAETLKVEADARRLTAESDRSTAQAQLQEAETARANAEAGLGGINSALGAETTRRQTAEAQATEGAFAKRYLPKGFRIFFGHTDQVDSAEYSSDGSKIATASDDNTARLWDAKTGKLLQTLIGHTDDVWMASFSNNGKRVVTASYDKTSRVWDASSGQLQYTFDKHTDKVRSAKFSKDGTRIVTASDDQTAKIWNTTNGQVIWTLRHSAPVIYAMFSPDARLVITTGRDHKAHLWDANTGLELRALDHKSDVWNADFNSDGTLVVTGDVDGVARIWNVNTGIEIQRLSASRLPLRSVAWSGDGKFIVTAGDDGIATVWNAEAGSKLDAIGPGDYPFGSAMFSPDGESLLTASNDSTAQIWKLSLP